MQRYFISSRQIFIVRFDAGELRNNDIVEEDEVFSEDTGGKTKKLKTRRRFGGGKTGDVIGRALDSNADLADAVARMDAADDNTQFIDAQCRNWTRAVNGFRLADELQLTMNWKDLPFDSRAIEAILVLHFEGTVSAEDFSIGQQTGDRKRLLVPARRENLRFIGLADEIADSHDSGDDVVKIKARDLTAVLIDTNLPPLTQKTIKSGSNIVEVISNLLDTLAGTAVEFIRGPFKRPANINLPALDKKRYSKLQTTAAARNKADGDPDIIVRNGSKGGSESYWDAITELCTSHGMIPLIELDKMVIQPPRTLFVGSPEEPGEGTSRFPTRHRQRIGDNAPTRRMVFGANLENLSFTRKFNRVAAPHVKVVSYNPDEAPDRRLIEVKYPTTTKKVVSTSGPTGNQKKIAYQIITVHGIVDRQLLTQIARSAYESLGRQQLGVRFSTSDPASFSSHPEFNPNSDPDLLDLRAGDPIQVLVAPTRGNYYGVNELNRMIQRAKRGSGFEDAISFLINKGFSRESAEELVRVLGGLNLPSEFRVVAASITGDLDAGDFSISVDARDYIRTRRDPIAATRRPPATSRLPEF